MVKELLNRNALPKSIPPMHGWRRFVHDGLLVEQFSGLAMKRLAEVQWQTVHGKRHEISLGSLAFAETTARGERSWRTWQYLNIAVFEHEGYRKLRQKTGLFVSLSAHLYLDYQYVLVLTVRQFSLSVLDTLLLCLAAVTGLILRDDFQIRQSQLTEILPYFAVTAIISIILVPVSGLNRTIWCFSGQHSFLRVAGVVIGTCLGAVVFGFMYNRLEGVPRSLPFLQAFVGITLLATVRGAYSLRSARGRHKAHQSATHFRQTSERVPEVTVLVVGMSRLTETYLQALRELHPGQVSVAGIVAETRDCVGRRLSCYPILGMIEDIETILSDLEVHGATVDRIVVVNAFRGLPKKAQEALVRIEQTRSITLQLLNGIFDLNEPSRTASLKASEKCSLLPSELGLEVNAAHLPLLPRRTFVKVKRAMDFLVALGLLVFLAPLLLLVGMLVATSIGLPVMFWQRRPGLGGKPFHLYKFRTMRAAYTRDGRILSDAVRVSRIGKFLRRTRLDELPQLFNILRGDMSFVGPRPLLPKDQPKGCAARLLVRPGLTGWAQVVGGRDISPDDKLALDIWYVRNASFLLDIGIAARTLKFVLLGESISRPLLERARRDLTASDTVKTEETCT